VYRRLELRRSLSRALSQILPRPAPCPFSGSDPEPVVSRAEVEPNGWVLALTGSWGPSNFASFALDPNGSPRVILRVLSQGFGRQDNRASPALKERIVLGTAALRVSKAGPPVDLTSLDEEVLPDGQRRLRIALSAEIYADDEVVGIELRPGWHVKFSSSSAPAVVSRSAVQPELPTMRWIVPTLMRATRDQSRRLELVVASGLSEGREAVAAVRFTATDGEQLRELWVLTASTSDGWGDRLRCWGVDAATLCEGLSPGPVTVHADVHPWIGRIRSTGAGHATSLAPSLGYGAEKPLMLLWDPEGTHMPEAHVMVNAATGTSNPSLVTVAGTLDAARAGVPAQSVSVAAQAIWLANRVVPAANGWPASLRAGDNAIIALAPGTATFGLTPTSAGAMTAQGRLIIQGDPYEPTPLACALELGQRPTWRYSLIELRNLRLGIGGQSFPLREAVCHLQNVETYARPGFEASKTALFTGSSTMIRLTMTASRWVSTALDLRSSSMRFAFFRSSELARGAASPVIIGCRHNGDQSAGFRMEGIELAGVPEASRDTVFWGNRILSVTSRALGVPSEPDGATVPNRTIHRFRLVNNLVEVVVPKGASYDGSKSPPAQDNILSFGENGWASAVHCLLEGNTLVGQRTSLFYNDPPTNLAQRQLTHRGNIVRNNFFDRNSTKQDDFNDPQYGQRPGFTQSWSHYYGVGRSLNIVANRILTSTSFLYAFPGLSEIWRPFKDTTQGNSWTRFVDDRSQAGFSAFGQGHGDYRPLNESPLVGRCQTATIDTDIDGVPRGTLFATGAFEPRV